MSEATITLDMSQWSAFLGRLKSRGSQISQMLEAVFGTIGYKDIQDHFRQEEGPEGRWKPRSETTQAMYAAIASGQRKPPKGIARGAFRVSNKLLQLTGTLRQSLLPGVVNVKRISRNAIMVLSNTEYSGKHDKGEGNVPQRKFMWISDKAQGTMAEAIVSMWLK